MTTFSIPKKIFLKVENLMCALRAHINQTHIILFDTKYFLFKNVLMRVFRGWLFLLPTLEHPH